MSLRERTGLLRRVSQAATLPVSKAAQLLTVSRKSLYTKAKEPTEQEIAAKHLIDKLHTDQKQPNNIRYIPIYSGILQPPVQTKSGRLTLPTFA